MSESDVIAKAAENMKILGGDPLADEVVPDNESVPAEDLKDVEDDKNVDDDKNVEGDSTPDKDDSAGDDDDSTPENDDEEDVDTDGDDVDTDEDAREADGQKDTPQLSDAYYRAAIHSGMSKEEIEDFMVASPDLAVKTFAKLHDTMNRATQEFSDLGRYRKEQAIKDKEKPAEEKPESSFKKVDLTSLKEEYPEGNPLIDVIEGMQGQMEKMDSELQAKPAQSSTQLDDKATKLEQEQVQHISNQINDFFGAPDMKVYAEFYGEVPKDATDWSCITPGAKMNRVAVISHVEQLIEGAAALGRDMEIGDALDRAHMLVSQPVQEKMIREDIMGKVRKRAKGITLKPSSGSTPDAATESPKTEKDVEDRAKVRLAKVFG